MAQRRGLASFAIGILPTGFRPQTEEPRSVPSDAGDGSGDFGKAGKGLAAISKTISHHCYPVGPSVPGPHQLGARLDRRGNSNRPLGFAEAAFTIWSSNR